MRLFSKPKPEQAPPPPSPEEIARHTMYQIVRQLDWMIESSTEDGGSLIVPKEDHIRLRCRLKLDGGCVDCEADAGIRLPLLQFSTSLLWAVTYSNNASRYGTFRVRNETPQLLCLCFGRLFDPFEISVSGIVKAIQMQSLTMHEFAHQQIKRSNLYFPHDFMGIESSTIPIRYK